MNRKLPLIISSAAILFTALVTRNGILLLLLTPLLIRFIQKAETENFSFEISREISDRRIRENEETEVILTIKNTGSAIARIRIEEHPSSSMEVTGGKTSILTTMPGDSFTTLQYRVKCRRGRHTFHPVSVETWNHFGLNRQRFKLESDDEIIAAPDSIQLGSLPINVRKTLVFAGLNPSGQGGDGVYFYDTREYQSGDSLRHIHWSAVARRPEKLISKEFEQERVSDIGIILDARHDAYEECGNSSSIEYAIEACSALSGILLSLQNRVGLLIYGKYLNWTRPGYGKMQNERIRHELSLVETGTHQVFKSLKNLPENLFPERSQLIFISPLMSNDIDFLRRLKGRGYMIIVIYLDCLSLSVDRDPLVLKLVRLEREIMIGNMERAGISVLKWDLNDSIENLIQRNRGKLRMALRGVR